MKSLLLLRHAKSSMKDTGLQDFDRTLNGGGKKDAETIGSFIKKKKVVPDLLLSSPAVRARETVETVVKVAKLTSELRYDQRIYEAGPLRLLEIVSQIEAERSLVLLVGHNPGIEDLLELLTDRVEHMATGTLAKIDLKADKWSKILEEKGTIDWIVKPSEIDED
ncbi:MAG: histidine phosphatase family protein [Pyrinomonadaceae bacterium]